MRFLAVLPALLAATASLASLVPGSHGWPAQKPNIIFILTDDQDVKLNSLDYMPLLKKHMVDQGTSFTRHYCTVSVCCPSRASMWTGLHAHNTNVTHVNPIHGGYYKFMKQGFNDKYLPIWLQQGGYKTYYSGKFLNVHNITNYNNPFPAGWTGSDFLLEPYTYQYNMPGSTKNQAPPQVYNGTYNTNFVFASAFEFLDEAAADPNGSPFFLTINPIAPHFEAPAPFPNGGLGPPVSDTPYKDMFKDLIAPRTPNFNPDVPSGGGWVRNLPKLTDSYIATNDEWYRLRLRSLQSVDAKIDELFSRLDALDLLDNTYVIYSSDNGFHIGNHRLPPGKLCPYEEDVNVPFIVRGPGVACGRVADVVTSHVDLAPTVLKLAGLPLRDEFDGTPIPVTAPDLDWANVAGRKREVTLAEMWIQGISSVSEVTGQILNTASLNTTYKSLRLVGSNYNLFYGIWCNNDHELYDMQKDPYQMSNLFPAGFNTTGDKTAIIPGLCASAQTVASRIDALMFILKTCKGAACRNPWQALLGSHAPVASLKDALDPKYDRFFNSVPRVQFAKCTPAQFLEFERPLFEEWKQNNATQAIGPQPSLAAIYKRCKN
ncbi:Arylsulphatase [Gonapodya prolifera JEL478]|uniref:Arylsulfatase n=1 Tax=Gonapodya prolifera (strain JEL478) TaxID=1344416 RepID=A0A139AKU7_GONPJ|nr:Arylsulphatase [Gonapodya prolifera JEL478]|eukprot:KXS17421.1 Arylsulphatase [Gonapodya prolifera JEL478]